MELFNKDELKVIWQSSLGMIAYGSTIAKTEEDKLTILKLKAIVAKIEFLATGTYKKEWIAENK
jgi:hypothetical protein